MEMERKACYVIYSTQNEGKVPDISLLKTRDGMAWRVGENVGGTRVIVFVFLIC